MKAKICSTVLVICLIIGLCLTFSACGILDKATITSAGINDSGELILTYSNGTEQNLGPVVGQNGTNGKDGTTVITSDKDIAVATSLGLRSAVSIVCKFQATIQQGGWRPGSGSTTTKNYSSAGTGVIYQIDKAQGDAFIITNFHVVYDSSSNTENGISDDISVYLYGSQTDEQAIKATFIGGSLYYDIAVLRIEDSDILKNSIACAVTVGNSDKVALGDGAIAIGNAKGLGISATSGVVSVDSEHITMTAADGKSAVSFRVMRVDTAINSGNSGGGLYNNNGELIGIVNAKIVYDGVENIGYAIPSNVAASVADNILHYCYGSDTERVQRASLGFSVSTSDSRAVLDPETGLVSIEETVSVYDVTDNSITEGVLQVGDILLSATFNGRTVKITRQHHAIDMMLDMRADDVVTFNIIRNGEEMAVSVTVTQACLIAY